jgi:hypothetical protein
LDNQLQNYILNPLYFKRNTRDYFWSKNENPIKINKCQNSYKYLTPFFIISEHKENFSSFSSSTGRGWVDQSGGLILHAICCATDDLSNMVNKDYRKYSRYYVFPIKYYVLNYWIFCFNTSLALSDSDFKAYKKKRILTIDF